MKKPYLSILSVIFISLFINAAYAVPPENLQCAKKTIINYYEDPNGYEKDVDAIVNKAEAILNESVIQNNQSGHAEKLAMVLDIDDTSITHFPGHKESDFNNLPDQIDRRYKEAKSPAIKPVLRLFNKAKELGVDVFFITARKPLENKPFEDLRPCTMNNLLKVGYAGWKELYLPRQDELALHSAEYKIAIRKALTENGYHIILNLGDQNSDLEGGYADHTFKIPNVLYTSSPCTAAACSN